MGVIAERRHTLLNRTFRVAAIGVGTMAGPGVLFLLPYILPLKEFANFASVLALSQLIMSLGGFGLDASCPRLAIHLKWATVYCFISIFIASVVVFLGFGSPLGPKLILASLIAWVGSLTTIFHSYSLFAGRARLYGIIGFAKALTFLSVLVLSIYLGISPELAWFFAALSGLLIALLLLMVNGGVALLRSDSKSGWKDLISFSAPLAIIVAGGATPFVLDRAIGQHILSSAEFARYAVAVTWAIPMIYIGNVASQSMIATKKDDSIRTILCWGGGLFFVGSIYFLFVGILALYFVSIPYFEDGRDFVRLWGWIVGWYIVYSSIGFPITAVTQKHFSGAQLKSLAYFTVAITIFSLLLAYSVYVNFFSSFAMENKTASIILFTAFFAITGLSPRIVFVFRHLSK